MDERHLKEILERDLAEINDIQKRAFQKCFVSPYSEVRHYSDFKSERLWIVGKIQDENVCFAYSETGYDGFELHWGLLFLDRSAVGDSGAWYRTLAELIDDCGYF
jgi:hypothetical protein